MKVTNDILLLRQIDITTGYWTKESCTVAQVCDLFRAGALKGVTLCFLITSDKEDPHDSPFDIPTSFWDALHVKASGFFGASAPHTASGVSSSYQTCSRILIKIPRGAPPDAKSVETHVEYDWHELGFWSRWMPSGDSLLLCFENRPILRERVAKHLCPHEPSVIAADIRSRSVTSLTPFAVLSYIFTQLSHCFDQAVWAWRDHVRHIENIRPTIDIPRPSQHFYAFLHELSRHTSHSTEMLTTALNVVEAMLDENEHAPLVEAAQAAKAAHRETIRVLRQEKTKLQCILERSRVLETRLRSEINIAYNVNAQHDTVISTRIMEAAQRDSTAMRTISILGLVFLPGTFMSAIFSMSFFNFQPAGDGSPQAWRVSNRFWIYWVITIPITAITIAAWHHWQETANKQTQPTHVVTDTIDQAAKTKQPFRLTAIELPTWAYRRLKQKHLSALAGQQAV